MKTRPWWHLAVLFALALAVRILTAWLLRQPGYTDAYYYAVGAQQLYAGQGLSEPFIWNYLDPPASVPHPGYRYWMPLTALFGWLGMATLGSSFRAMQTPFVLASALLPLVAYTVAWDLTGKQKHAWLAGLLAVFPGFYAHVFVLPDNFALFALAGSICLWTAGRGLRDRRPLWFGASGVAAGLGHLARVDGLLLLGIALVAALAAGRLSSTPSHRTKPGGSPDLQVPSLEDKGRAKMIAANLFLVTVGYLSVMTPWFLRNWLVLGTPLAGAGSATLFLTNYDDMFAYGRQPTLESYLAWGWKAILASKLDALLLNLQRLWMENLLIVLLPFSALGLWHLRRERLLWPFFLYLPLLFVAMTFAFTFPGMRGGLFHSGGALLPFLFAAAGPGLEVTLRWAARRFRGWRVTSAWRVFSAGLVGLAMLVTLLALWRTGVLTGAWNERDWGYTEIGDWLTEQGTPEAVVMVGNPPGFTWHTEHRAVAVPNEALDTILAVADRYDARYLVLDSTRPRTTDALYAGETSHPRLILRHTIGPDERPWQVYEVMP